MQLKIRSENIEIENLKIIQTMNVLKVSKEISDQQKCVIINPFTKIKDLFKISSSSMLYKELISNDLFNKIINEQEIEQKVQEINMLSSCDLIESNLSVEKMMKTIFNVKDDYVNTELINFYLKLLNKYSDKGILVLIMWDPSFIFQQIKKSIDNTLVNVVFITPNARELNLTYNQLELLVIVEKEVIDIIDYDKFKAWLEIKTKTVITNQNIQNYFSNLATNKSDDYLNYKIDLAIKNLIF